MWRGRSILGWEIPRPGLPTGAVVGDRQTEWGRVGSQDNLSCRASSFLLQEAVSFIHSFIHSLTHSLVLQKLMECFPGAQHCVVLETQRMNRHILALLGLTV